MIQFVFEKCMGLDDLFRLILFLGPCYITFQSFRSAKLQGFAAGFNKPRIQLLSSDQLVHLGQSGQKCQFFFAIQLCRDYLKHRIPYHQPIRRTHGSCHKGYHWGPGNESRRDKKYPDHPDPTLSR